MITDARLSSSSGTRTETQELRLAWLTGLLRCRRLFLLLRLLLLLRSPPPERQDRSSQARSSLSMSAGSPSKLFQSGWQGLVGVRHSGTAVLAPTPDALVLADGRSAAVLALPPSPLVLADGRSAAVLALAPDALVLADARSAAVLALPPDALVLADARSAAVLAPSPDTLTALDRPRPFRASAGLSTFVSTDANLA